MQNDAARENRRKHQHDQPGHALDGHLHRGGFEIFAVAGQQGGHFLEVLGVLFFDDVHDVVRRDDAHQAVFVVYHRNGEQVVFAHGVGHGFLVVERLYAHAGGSVHQGFHGRVVRRQDQLAQGHRAQPVPAAVDHVERVDRFLINARALHLVQCLAGGGARVEFAVFDRHDRARGVFRVF